MKRSESDYPIKHLESLRKGRWVVQVHGSRPTICIGIVLHVRQFSDGCLKIESLLQSLEQQSDLPDTILICDTQPDEVQPDFSKFPKIRDRITVLRFPMRTVQEGYNFYPSARNRILSACRSDIIIWLDADERPDLCPVENVRRTFVNGVYGAGVLCFRGRPGYWNVCEDLSYASNKGFREVHLRIFRVDMLRAMGRFEEGKWEWGTLATKVWDLQRKGKVKVSLQKNYVVHDNECKIFSLHPARLISLMRHPTRRVLKARIAIATQVLVALVLSISGYAVLGVLLFLLPFVAAYFSALGKSRKGLRLVPEARFRHIWGAALLSVYYRWSELIALSMSRSSKL